MNSKNNSELCPVNYVGSGFLKSNVDFRIGKHDINKISNSFSDKVKCVKGVGGVIQIFLEIKGDVWPLYMHWFTKWNDLTPNNTIHNYEWLKILNEMTIWIFKLKSLVEVVVDLSTKGHLLL